MGVSVKHEIKMAMAIIVVITPSMKNQHAKTIDEFEG